MLSLKMQYILQQWHMMFAYEIKFKVKGCMWLITYFETDTSIYLFWDTIEISIYSYLVVTSGQKNHYKFVVLVVFHLIKSISLKKRENYVMDFLPVIAPSRSFIWNKIECIERDKIHLYTNLKLHIAITFNQV